MGVVDEFIKDPVLPINWNALTKISNQRLNRVDYAAVSKFVWPEPVEPFPECLCFQGETPLEDAAAALSVCHWPPSWLARHLVPRDACSGAQRPSLRAPGAISRVSQARGPTSRRHKTRRPRNLK